MKNNGKLKSGGFAVEVEQLPELWHDRKRHLGLPISFTVYSLNADKLLVNTGLLSLQEEEVLLYRVRDISLSQTLGERLFGVGTVRVSSSDVSVPHLELTHVKDPRKVKEVLSKCVEESRRKNGIRSTELMSGGHGEPVGGPPPADLDGDGIPDLPIDADGDGIPDLPEQD